MNNIDKLKQLREAREKATQGEWRSNGREIEVHLNGKILDVESDKERQTANIEYITLLHNNAEELIRMAEAGQALAEAVRIDNKCSLAICREHETMMCRECRIEEALDTYNKTVSK